MKSGIVVQRCSNIRVRVRFIVALPNMEKLFNSYVLKLMAILAPYIVGLLDAIGPMPSGCTNSPPSSFQSTLSDIFTCLKANFFQFFLESCNPMVVLAIVCVAPAHPVATMQWAGLWGHVGAHNGIRSKEKKT